jgi:hypothetical protein
MGSNPILGASLTQPASRNNENFSTFKCIMTLRLVMDIPQKTDVDLDILSNFGASNAANGFFAK